MTALVCAGVAAGYDGHPVVRGLDLSVAPGEVVALLGPNGAGKTTLLNTLAGLLPPIAGSISVLGEPIGRRPAALSRRGLVLVPDDRSLFTTLTVRENVSLALRRGARLGLADVLDLFPSLADRADLAAGQLSGGEQQMLALARALVQDPKVLLIDELSMGLAPVIVDQLLPIVRQVADEAGAAVVLVEQHVRQALAVADRGAVLVHGELVMDEPTTVLLEEPDLVEKAYLG